MREVERIADQLRRSLEGDAWHGPSLGELLSDVEFGNAATKPASGAHSIWEVVLHITAWKRAALNLLSGEAGELLVDADWPSVSEHGESGWKKTVEELQRVSRHLGEAVLGVKDDRLDDVVPGKSYSYYVLLHGMVQHTLYHAGQIAVLKKG